MTNEWHEVKYTDVRNDLTVEDRNAQFHMKDVPGTFREIAVKLFHTSLGEKKNVIWSTNSFKVITSNLRRGIDEEVAKNS